MEELTLYKHIYKDCEMSIFSLDTLLDDLQNKDNKIKKVVEEIREGYGRYFDEVKEALSDDLPKKSSMVTKMAASMGIGKEVRSDNSDSSIADMLIKGISMGTLDMQKKIAEVDKKVEKKELKFANDFLEFQQDCVTGLKRFL